MSLAERDRLVLGREPLDRHDRPEDLLAHDPHRRRHVGEDRRAVEEAGLQLGLVGSPAAGHQPGALGDGARHVGLDLGAVPVRDERAGFGRVVEPVAEPDQVRAPPDLLDEPVVDRVLDDRPAAGRADLARVREGGGQRVVDRGLEVGVVEHDVGALAAHLERDLLEVDGGAAPSAPGRPRGRRSAR